MAETLAQGQDPEYTGDIKFQPKPGEKDKSGLLYPYLPGPGLVKVVNLAIRLKRPLLLKGEPGCGKTRLARAVAYEFEKRYGSWSYEAWYVKSTSRARDGLYLYDAVGRLRDAQIAAARGKQQGLEAVPDDEKYIKLSYLGRAFESQHRAIVLIDEIDKADIDFPNDLLRELDQNQFTIEETGKVVPDQPAQYPPIVFITSNDEKDLPAAFLRRCLFYYFQFPTREELTRIIKAHFANAESQLIEKLVDPAIDRFLQLRAEMEANQSARKKVSTSELIDWFRALSLEEQEEVLNKMNGRLPQEYASILLKNWEDHLLYAQQNHQQGNEKRI